MADGEGCKCWATCEGECTCGVDWTPKEVYDLRRERAKLIERLKDAEVVVDKDVRLFSRASIEFRNKYPDPVKE